MKDEAIESTAPRPTAKLANLPDELLRQIAEDLPDTPSLMSFARVGRRFPAAVEKRLWRNLELSVPPTYGFPSTPTTDPYKRQSEKEKADTLQEVGIRRKVEKVLAQGNKRRWKRVEAISMILRPSATLAMIEVIKRVAPNLKTLEVQARFDLSLHWPDRLERFDRWMLDRRIDCQFPALTSVTLGHKTTIHVRFIPFLLSIAPNISTLAICIENNSHKTVVDGRLTLRFPISLSKDTKLEKLRIVCREEYSHEDDRDPVDHCHSTFISLIDHSLLLRQVSLHYDPPAKNHKILDAILRLKKLVDFSWAGCYGFPTKRNTSTSALKFPALKRVVVNHYDWEIPFRETETFPQVESIFFNCAIRWGDFDDFPPTFFSPPSPVQLLNADFAKWVRGNHALHRMSWFRLPELGDDESENGDRNLDVYPFLDALQAAGEHTGIISSVRHGEKEVLHVRFLVQEIEIGSEDYGRKRGAEGSQRRRILYTSGNQADLERRTVSRSQPGWQRFTEMDGKMVPLEVLDRMREVEGLSVGEWEKRGVEAGDEAWQVLLDWRKSV